MLTIRNGIQLCIILLLNLQRLQISTAAAKMTKMSNSGAVTIGTTTTLHSNSNKNNNNNNNVNDNNNNNNNNISSSSSNHFGNGQRFAMEPQDQTAIVGSRVTLPCRVITKQGELQWTKDDFGLGTHRNLSGFERYSMVGSDEEGDFSLDIYPVMLDDDAKYQCQVGPGPQGQPGIRSRFATLTILVPPEAPKIIQGDFLVTTEDREIELECVSLGGKPAAEITWIDGLGNVLATGIDYMKEPLIDSRRFTAKSILKLTPKKEHHNTTFTCQAQNTADRTYRSAKLKLEVKYAPKVSVSVIGEDNLDGGGGGRIPEGAEVRLSCHSDANPSNVTYRWYIDEELVIGDYTTEMVIHNVSRKFHDAIVKCEVHNAVGKSEESETLDISYGPIFKIKPKSTEADLDASITLSCDVDGNPNPEIFWIHEPSDRLVSTNSNVTITVTPETIGKYFCKASVSGFPEIFAEASVYLKGPPTIISQRRQFGMTGDNARIECIAFSVPKARHVSWTFNGKEINPNSDHDYSILEDPLPDGIKSTLIIRESNTKHFGRYNCTVVNDHGNDVLEIDLIAQKNIPSLMITVVSVTSIAILIMIMLMFFVLYFKKGKKKLPPADVIPEHHINEKGCKESDRSSNISDLKVDIRSGSCEPDYSETCSGRDSIVTRIAANKLGLSSDINDNSGVPLAGPVKIPTDYRYSGEYNDTILTGHTMQLKSGQNNNGYVPFADYSLDYPPPLSLQQQQQQQQQQQMHQQLPHHQLQHHHHHQQHQQQQPHQYHHTLNLRTNTIQQPMAHMNGQLPSGNLTLTRNRNDLRQDNGLPNLQQGSLNSLQNGLLGQPLLQNGLSIDPRYSAAYGNPYLRTSNASLPPLPPPSTANPAATPAPPPYNSIRNNINSNINNNNNSTINSSSGNNIMGLVPINGAGGGLGSSNLPTTSLSTSTIVSTAPSIGQLSLSSNSPISTNIILTPQQTTTSPSGQFILPANGNLKKGSLATHV